MTPERLADLLEKYGKQPIEKILEQIEALEERCRGLEEQKTGPIVDTADLKADVCGCNVVMKRYSNPFHRAYYAVSRCEHHNSIEAQAKRIAELTQEIATLEERCRGLEENIKSRGMLPADHIIATQEKRIAELEAIVSAREALFQKQLEAYQAKDAEIERLRTALKNLMGFMSSGDCETEFEKAVKEAEDALKEQK